jgi:hypothetical protein
MTSERSSRILNWKYAKPDGLRHSNQATDRNRDSAQSNQTLFAQDETSELAVELPGRSLDRADECSRTFRSTHAEVDG